MGLYLVIALVHLMGEYDKGSYMCYYGIKSYYVINNIDLVLLDHGVLVLNMLLSRQRCNYFPICVLDCA